MKIDGILTRKLINVYWDTFDFLDEYCSSTIFYNIRDNQFFYNGFDRIQRKYIPYNVT